jgi:hypothetical protein
MIERPTRVEASRSIADEKPSANGSQYPILDVRRVPRVPGGTDRKNHAKDSEKRPQIEKGRISSVWRTRMFSCYQSRRG